MALRRGWLPQRVRPGFSVPLEIAVPVFGMIQLSAPRRSESPAGSHAAWGWHLWPSSGTELLKRARDANSERSGEAWKPKKALHDAQAHVSPAPGQQQLLVVAVPAPPAACWAVRVLDDSASGLHAGDRHEDDLHALAVERAAGRGTARQSMTATRDGLLQGQHPDSRRHVLLARLLQPPPAKDCTGGADVVYPCQANSGRLAE
jgi:hypothetical protein